MITLLVAVAGGCGAACRFVLDGVLAGRELVRLPAATLTINVLGSFLLGLLVGWVPAGPAPVLWVLGAGFCGGFTTFSSASVELVRLAQAGRRGAAVALAALMLLLAIAAAAAGLGLGGRLRG